MRSMIGIPNMASSLDLIMNFLILLAKKWYARSVIAKLVFAASCYFIWQEWNDMLFAKKKRSQDQVIDSIKSTICLKPLTCKFKKTMVVQMLLQRWKLPYSLIQDFKQSHSVFLGHVLDPQDLERNKQVVGTRLPFTQLDEGTHKSQILPEGTSKTKPLHEGTHGDKDSAELKQPADMEPSTTPVVTFSEVEPGTETLQLTTFADVQALLLFDDEMIQESDDDDVLEAREEMDEDIPPTKARSPPSNQEHPKSSHAQETNESDSNSSCPDALRKYNNIFPLTEIQLHEEAAISYADLRASIKGYYIENVDHREQTDKLVQETMNCLDKNSTDKANLLKALNGVTKTLKVIQDAIKDDPALNKKVIEATEAYTKNLTNLTKLLTLAATEEPPSQTKGETDHMETQVTEEDKVEKEQEPEEPTNTVLVSSFRPLESTTSASTPLTSIISTSQPEPPVPQKEGKGITTDEQLESQPKLVKASSDVHPDPDAPILVPYEINLKLFQLTEKQIQAYIDKEEMIKQAKIFEMTKNAVIKVVHKEAEKIGLDPKKVKSAKGGEKFKKI
ncbi:hypothetical protein Tco_0650108 [Tanacetum coccineum]